MVISYLQFITAAIIFSGVVFYGIKKNEETAKKSPDDDVSVYSSVAIKNVADFGAAGEKQANVKSEKSFRQSRSLGKPGAAVRLKNIEPFHVPGPGVYEYPLQLISSAQGGMMKIVVSVSDGITITSSKQQFEFALQDKGEYMLPLTINASREGRFYIQLHVALAAGDEVTSRVIAAVLEVGEPVIKAQKAGVNSSAVDSDNVVSLPAQETISPQ